MTTLDARLHLLDRQLVDADGDPVGIVDDLEIDGVEVDADIAPGTPPPEVTSLLSGQVLATRIFGGSPPRSRLQEIPWNLVSCIGVTVQLDPTEVAVDVQWVEEWLRDHIVARIPGGRHAAE
ncbi:PRC-barrel domain-containing protein [Mycolicibacterium sp. XJ870]